MPGILTSPVPNVTTPSPSEELWNVFNQESHREEVRNNTGSVSRDEGYSEIVSNEDAAWGSFQTLEEEGAMDQRFQALEVENIQDYDVHEEEICQEGDPTLAVSSVSLKHDPQLDELAQARADTHYNCTEISSHPSRRLKLNPKISDNPKTIDARPVGTLWRSRCFNTTRWQAASSNAEPSYLPPQFSTPGLPGSPDLAMTRASKKRTREGGTIDRDTSIRPFRVPKPHSQFLSKFNTLHISTWESENNDPNVILMYTASLREMRDSLVEQIAGSEEREKVANRSEGLDEPCKEDEARYVG
jgi:hypothetical protein